MKRSKRVHISACGIFQEAKSGGGGGGGVSLLWKLYSMLPGPGLRTRRTLMEESKTVYYPRGIMQTFCYLQDKIRLIL